MFTALVGGGDFLGMYALGVLVRLLHHSEDNPLLHKLGEGELQHKSVEGFVRNPKLVKEDILAQKNQLELYTELDRYKPGHEVEVRFYRGNSERSTKVVLGDPRDFR